jgi:hypothetical protein
MRQVKEKYSTTSALAYLVFSLLTRLLLYCGNVSTRRRLTLFSFNMNGKFLGTRFRPVVPT